MSAEQFEFGGVHHVALVSSDMARTVDFYTNVLGMPLVKTLELPGGGQHFFFDCGNGDCLAFFWYPDSPGPAEGVASADARIRSAVGSMNHLAITVAADRFDDYVQRLADLGLDTFVLNHDDSESTIAEELHDGVFVRSVYFRDPDGILLEFACWTRDFDDADIQDAPATADGTRTQVPAR